MLKVKKYSEYLPVQTAVTIGKFDGFHLGHRKLLSAVLQEKEYGLSPCVVSFSAVNEAKRSYIYTKEEQSYLCESLGIEVMAEYPFDEELREMTAEQFVSEVLCKRLQAKVIVAGEDFRFGRNRTGDVALLKRLEEAYGYRTVCVPKVMIEGERVSSTRIRELLADGHVEKANELLGDPYAVCGEVRHGKKLGRTLGFPTLNLLPPQEKLLPAFGVYVTRTKVEDTWYYGITNIGLRPTVDTDATVSVETHLLQCDADLYGNYVEVQFLHFLRAEQKFESVDALKDAIQKDFIQTKEYLKEI